MLTLVLLIATAQPNVAVREIDADVAWVDERSGDGGVLFSAKGVELKNLAGKKVTWTLYVKRKLAPWTSARNFPFAVTRPKTADDVEKLISAPLLHMTLALDGYLPGEHEAAIVGSDGKAELFRAEIPFVLKAGVFRPLTRR